jgi:hypothetical protein
VDGFVLWQFRFDTQGMIQMSETGTYVRYTQEIFTNKFAMQAMMQNNQVVASENAELLFKYGLVRCTCGVVDDERNSSLSSPTHFSSG